jgi:Tat protein secretion system quality control protein TatD with DNase activity
VEKLAELKGLSPDDMADVLAENARRVFLNGKEP